MWQGEKKKIIFTLTTNLTRQQNVAPFLILSPLYFDAQNWRDPQQGCKTLRDRRRTEMEPQPEKKTKKNSPTKTYQYQRRVWYPCSFFIGPWCCCVSFFFFFLSFFFTEDSDQCGAELIKHPGLCEGGKKCEGNLRAEQGAGSSSSEPSDGQRWGVELPLKCRRTQMRFCRLPPRVQRQWLAHSSQKLSSRTARGLWNIEAFARPGVWAAGAHINLLLYHQTTTTSGSDSDTPLSDAGGIHWNSGGLFHFLNGGVFDIKIAETEKRKRNLSHFSFLSWCY